jgi:undecaprenyl-diphosphatase
LRNLLVSSLPVVVVGAALHRTIKTWLFAVWPVVAALALGGVLMVLVDAGLRKRSRASTRTLDSITMREALAIGMVQCLSLWPGTSRAMVTIIAGLWLGLPATVAAEYSFLLALPMLGAATVLDAMVGGRELLRDVGWVSVSCGFLTSALMAVVAMRAFVRYLTRHGLALFGWYRLALASGIWLMAQRP